MRRIVSVLVCVSLITYPALVLAEECREPRAVTRPCEGVLLPPQAAAKALKCLEVSLPKLELELAREKELCSIRLSAMELRIKALGEHNTRLEELLSEAISIEPVTKPIWENNVFWAVTGFLLGSLATVGITYSVAEALD